MKYINYLAILFGCFLSFLPFDSQAQTKELDDLIMDFPDYLIEEGVKEYEAKNITEALKVFQDVISMDPFNEKANVYIGNIRKNNQEYGLALTALNRVISSENTKRTPGAMWYAYDMRSDIYLLMGDTINAINDLTQGINTIPDNIMPHSIMLYKRAQLNFELKNYEQSDADYQKLKAYDEGVITGYVGMGRNAYAQGRFEDALNQYNLAIKLAPNDAEPYRFRAQTFLALKKYNEASDDIIKSLAIDKDNDFAHYLMINSDKSLYPFLKVKLQVKANKDKNDSDWYFYLGQLSEENNQYKEAIDYYKKSYNIENTSVCLKNISDCYYILGNYDEALKFIDKAISIAPDDDYLIEEKGNILNEMGRRDEAIKMLDAFIDKNPDYAYGYYLRGWVKDEKGDNRGAIDDYTYSIVLDPEYTYAYIGRGQNYEKLGEIELAKADYYKVIELEPEPVENSCAQYAYLFLGEKDKAIDFMNRYLEKDDGGEYDAACFYSLMGDSKKALFYLEQAFEHGFRRFAHIAVDSDLDNVRELPKFKELIAKYKKIAELER